MITNKEHKLQFHKNKQSPQYVTVNEKLNAS